MSDDDRVKAAADLNRKLALFRCSGCFEREEGIAALERELAEARAALGRVRAYCRALPESDGTAANLLPMLKGTEVPNE